MPSDNSNNSVSVDPNALLEPFTQAPYWAEFQAELGRKIHLLNGDGWSALIIENSVPTGIYWFIPYGPIADSKDSLKQALQEITAKAKVAKALWIRFEPRVSFGYDFKGAMKAPKDINPKHTTMSDLRPSEEDLYLRLGKTNRQRVNKQKRQPKVVLWTSTDPADMEKFIIMQKLVANRTGAVFHEPDYLRTQARVLMPQGHLRLEFVGLKPGDPLAATVIHDYKATATYTYAASLPESRDYDAANLLIWQAMLNAKARGMTTFDFWGIAEPNALPNHPWQGFTAFKRSFGTQDITFAGTWDIPLSPQYRLYRARSLATSKLKEKKQRTKYVIKKLSRR